MDVLEETQLGFKPLELFRDRVVREPSLLGQLVASRDITHQSTLRDQSPLVLLEPLQ